MARRRHFGHVGSHKRLTQWIGPAAQGYIAVASTGATLISSSSFSEAATVVRTRGVVSVQPGSFSADLNFIGGFGVAIVSQDALGIGITAVPKPLTDSSWGGWLVWRTFAGHLDVQSAVGFDVQSMVNFEVDSKSMRKFSPNEAMIMVAESETGAFDIYDGTRSLIKLS